MTALALLPGLVQAQEGKPEPASAYSQKSATEGVSLGLKILPLEKKAEGGARLTEGDLVRFELSLADAGTGTPLPRLYPAAWMDRKPSAETAKSETCGDKLKMLLGGNLFTRAELNLNAYYVLAMNEDATLNVVDPLFGYGGSKLLAQVTLRSPGQDWVLGPEPRRLFVSQPAADAVAVIEPHGWKVVAHIPTGPAPSRLALQPDGAYLWAGFDRAEPGQEASGVSVLETATLQERARIRTGRGHHEIAFSVDDRFAFVTNAEDGTVAVVDVRKLEVVRTIPTGKNPVSLTWCETARTVYVANEGDGTIAAISEREGGHEVVSRMETKPGLAQIRCAPGGRLALAVNPKEDLLHVVDGATQRVVQTGPVADGPDQVSFSDTLAYVRHLGSDVVLMLPLGELGKAGAPLPVIDFPGGEAPPGRGLQPSLAPAIVRAPGANAVLVANPADKVIYYYVEGMAAPMGSFQNYGHQPRAVLVLDNSLRESAPGVYANTVRLPRSGSYDVVFFLDNPRLAHCFPVEVAADPVKEAARRKRPLQVKATGDAVADGALEVRPGEDVRLTLEVTDPDTGQALPGLQDLSVMVMLSPGTWHAYSPARDVGGGRYEVAFRLPQEGLYYVYAESASRGLAVGGARPVLYVYAEAGKP